MTKLYGVNSQGIVYSKYLELTEVSGGYVRIESFDHNEYVESRDNLIHKSNLKSALESEFGWIIIDVAETPEYFLKDGKWVSDEHFSDPVEVETSESLRDEALIALSKSRYLKQQDDDKIEKIAEVKKILDDIESQGDISLPTYAIAAALVNSGKVTVSS